MQRVAESLGRDRRRVKCVSICRGNGIITREVHRCRGVHNDGRKGISGERGFGIHNLGQEVVLDLEATPINERDDSITSISLTYGSHEGRTSVSELGASRIVQKNVLIDGVVCTVVVDDQGSRTVPKVYFKPEVRDRVLEGYRCLEPVILELDVALGQAVGRRS